MDVEDYRNIWIVALIENKELTVSLLKLIGYARLLGDNVGSWVELLVLGDGVTEDLAKELIQYGADNVYLVKGEGIDLNNIELVAKVIHKVVMEKKPEFLLFIDNIKNRAIASYVSGLLDRPVITGCIKIDIDPYDRFMRGTKPVFEGQLLAVAEARGAGYPQIATINPLLYSLPFKDEFRSGRVNTIEVNVSELDAKTKTKSVEKIKVEEPHNWKSKVVVAVGEEVSDKELLEKAKSKLGKLGIYVGVTKALADLGVAPRDYLLGPLGKIIRPDLLVMLGSPTLIEKMYGFPKQPHILTVTKDSNAPSVKASRYYAIGNASEILEEVIKEVDKIIEGE